MRQDLTVTLGNSAKLSAMKQKLVAMRARLRTAVVVVAGAMLLPVVALAWTQGADFETHIHGHEFSRVTLDSNGCDLKVRLLFAAPEEGYKHAASARNFYRFHARIKLDDGRAIVTRIFSNSAPGLRAYTYVVDTKAETCWAKGERKIQGIDVEGCRGAGCKPEAFK
jgi:hypothetical protein